MIVVGEAENLFHHLQVVEVVPTWEEAFEAVNM